MSVHAEIAPVLLEFVADMHLLPFGHGMRGPSAQGFVGALDFFLSRHVSPDIGVVRVESESVFPSDHYPVRLRLPTLPALVARGNPTSRARFKLGSSVCQWQLEASTDSCSSRHSMPLADTPEAYHHFVGVMTTTAEVVFGPPTTPDTVPGQVSSAAKILHTLVKAHPRWWLNAPLTHKVVAARKAV